MIKININQLFEKEMDRKDFMKTIAVGIIALTGVGAALRVLNSMGAESLQSTTRSSQHATSFGSSVYGGLK